MRTKDIVPASAAGSFYPQSRAGLEGMLDALLSKANPPALDGNIRAMISPHAGYIYSGQTAAAGYRLLRERPYTLAVILGADHHLGFAGVSLFLEGKFATPLGEAEVDAEFAQKLTHKDKDIFFEPAAFSGEHSLEVQLPFLQRVLKNFKILPVIMGQCGFGLCLKLARLINDAGAGRNDIIVIASSDMYHGYDVAEAERVDRLTLAAIEKGSPQELFDGLRDERFQLCGGFGAVTALAFAKAAGCANIKVLDYANSARVTGNKEQGQWTVGYASVAMY
jgi:AmmeMemoRadiSam system protein B